LRKFKFEFIGPFISNMGFPVSTDSFKRPSGANLYKCKGFDAGTD